MKKYLTFCVVSQIIKSTSLHSSRNCITGKKPYSATANNMTKSWARDVHPARRPKGRSRKKPKINSTLGKEEADEKNQN